MAEDLNLELNKDDFEDIELSDIEKLLKLLNSDAKTKESDLKEFDYDILDDNDWFESDTEEKIKWTIESMKDMKEKISFIEGIIKHVKVFEIKRKEERQKMLEQMDELSWISMSDYRHTEPEPIQSKSDISSNFSLNWQNNQSPINLSVSWQNNQSSFFDWFSLTSSQTQIRPVTQWNDLGLLSYAINKYNEVWLSKEEITNYLEYWMDNISDENIILSMQKELIAIKKWKQSDDLTYLLISYSVNKEKEMTKWMSLARWAHNETQQYYINNIIWNTKWYSEKYIQWYNTDLWNYIKEVKDFEESAKHKKPDSINSLELNNYLFMLEEKWKLNTTNLLKVFWREFLLGLWDIWEENRKEWRISLLQNKIIKWGYESLFNISEITDDQLNIIQPLVDWYKENINTQNKEYFILSNNKKTEVIEWRIKLITDKNKLNEVLDYAKEKWVKVPLKSINISFNKDYFDNENISIWYLSINSLSKDTIQKNIWTIIEKIIKDNWSESFNIDMLLNRAVILDLWPKFISDIIYKYNIKIDQASVHINKYIWDYKLLEKDDFINIENYRKRYNNFESLSIEQVKEIQNDKENLPLLINYIIENTESLVNPRSIIHKIYYNLIKNDIFWWNTELLYLNHKNKDISKLFLDKWLIIFISKEHLSDPDIINYFLENVIKKSNLENLSHNLHLLSFFDLSDINRVLQIFKFVTEIWHFENDEDWKILERFNIIINQSIKQPEIQYIIMDSLINAKEANTKIEPEYKEQYFILINEMKMNNELFWDAWFHNSNKKYSENLKQMDDKGNKTFEVNSLSEEIKKQLLLVKWLNKSDITKIIDLFTVSEIESWKLPMDLELTLRTVLKDYEWLKWSQFLYDVSEVIINTIKKKAEEELGLCHVSSKTPEGTNNFIKIWNTIISESWDENERYIDENWEYNQVLIRNEILELKKWSSKDEFIEKYKIYISKFSILEKDYPEDYNKLINMMKSLSLFEDAKLASEDPENYVDYLLNGDWKWFRLYYEKNINSTNSDSTNINNNTISNTELTNVFINESYNYDIDNNIIKTQSWDEIPVIEEDKKNLNSKENIENYISLYQTLGNLRLMSLWPHINTISNAIWTTGWINNNSWFLEPVEQQKIINCILISVWMKPLGNFITMEEYIWKYERDIFWFDWTTENDSTRIWETKVDEEFLKRYVTNRPKFAHDEFKDSLNKKRNY